MPRPDRWRYMLPDGAYQDDIGKKPEAMSGRQVWDPVVDPTYRGIGVTRLAFMLPISSSMLTRSWATGLLDGRAALSKIHHERLTRC